MAPSKLALVAAVCTSSLAACPGGSGTGDGGSGDGSDGATGRLLVRLKTDDSVDAVEVTRARVGLERLRARNDRGGSLEPERESVGRVDLLAEEEPVVLAPAAPATYGRLEMRLEAGGWGPGFVLGLDERERRLEVELERGIDAEVACERATVLGAGGEARLQVELDVGSLQAEIEQLELPSDGTVRITEASEPEAADRLAGALETAWSLECEAEESGSGGESGGE